DGQGRAAPRQDRIRRDRLRSPEDRGAAGLHRAAVRGQRRGAGRRGDLCDGQEDGRQELRGSPMIVEQSLRGFLDELASYAPTPGGGSAAALMGAMGAALVAMVCSLTIGRRDYESVEAEMRRALAEAEALRQRLTAMIEA